MPTAAPSLVSGLRGVGILAAAVLAIAGCNDPGNSSNVRAFAQGQKALDRLEPVPAAERLGRDQKSVLGDDGAPGETVQGATRLWKLTDPKQTNRTVLGHYDRQVTGLGYRLGTRAGDANRSHRNWFRGDACIRVIVTNNRLIVLTAEAKCAGGGP